ncbi:MAG: peptidoglycan bridge formation glycyltransferase FemA/FemB family protein [Anaerolineales bacterium]|nr:peptidoglycan bridge formation glycyltransferase FemA/FemB family protein [Anaerolineales bacterium]MBX3038879.1 peptidoglycan bridge formation glycyltransferase FemA/FemB family protein [Anaerolineales bacterium]
MTEVTFSEWNQFIANYPNAHLLQMGEWGELKKDFGWKPVRIISENVGAQILFRKLPLGLTIGYMPKPIVSNELRETSSEFWNEIDSVCKKHNAIFLKIEPDAWQDDFQLITHHSSLVTSVHNIQPPNTIIISIKEDEEQILARMKPKCRYNIRLAEKKGVTVRAWDDIESFHQMMLITGGRDNFGVHSKEYYQRAYDLFHPKGICELLVAEFEGKPLASLMVFANGKRAWYVYGASNNEERNRMPTYLLQWEAIRWAKSKGCEEYDLWGVPDESEETLEAQFESRHDGLWGVYRFKRGFGGELKRAAQALDKVYNPLLYWMYTKFVMRNA